MATKDNYLSLKDKQQTFANNNSQIDNGKQYSNFSLNQNHKSSDFSPVSGYSKKYMDRYGEALLKEPVSSVSVNGKDKLQTWNESSNLHLKSLKLNDEVKEGDKKRWNKNDSSNSTNNNKSTLSLHISAYENSVDTVLDSFDGKNKQESGKQSFDASIFVIQNPFEFPRQQNDKASEPEMSHYNASQYLMTPQRATIEAPKMDTADGEELPPLHVVEHDMDRIYLGLLGKLLNLKDGQNLQREEAINREKFPLTKYHIIDTQNMGKLCVILDVDYCNCDSKLLLDAFKKSDILLSINGKPALECDDFVREFIEYGGSAQLLRCHDSSGAQKILDYVQRSSKRRQVNQAPVTANVNQAPITANVNQAPITANVNQAPITANVNQAPITANVNQAPVTANVNQAPVTAKAADQNDGKAGSKVGKKKRRSSKSSGSGNRRATGKEPASEHRKNFAEDGSEEQKGNRKNKK